MAVDETQVVLVWKAISADHWKRVSGFSIVWVADTASNRQSVVGMDEAIVRAALEDDPEFSVTSAAEIRIVRV